MASLSHPRPGGTTAATAQVPASGADDLAARCIDTAAVFALAATVLDVVTTWFALSGQGYLERNPIMRSFIDDLGLVPTLVLSFAVRVGIVLALMVIARRAPRSLARLVATVMLVGVAAWWCVIVFANSVVIGRAV